MGRSVSSRPVSNAPVVATPTSDEDSASPTWTVEELLKVRHLGPGVIGKEMFEAAQALMDATAGGKLGPAIMNHDDPASFQGGPIRIENGRPIYADPAVQAYRDSLREAAGIS
jgi:hypothetical protein